MDEALRERLKQLGLLPVEADAEALEYWKQQAERLGIDTNDFETHNSPSALEPFPQSFVDRQRRVRENAVTLYEMDIAGKDGSKQYQAIEDQVWEDINSLTDPAEGCWIHVGREEDTLPATLEGSCDFSVLGRAIPVAIEMPGHVYIKCPFTGTDRTYSGPYTPRQN